MDILRMIVGMIGVLVCFISLLNVWLNYMNSADTTFYWTIAIIGGLLWLQAIPVLNASDRAELKQKYLNDLNRKK